ncbi:MAG: thioredoxin domain-containing protein, partial [Candidatus Thorarchaeota archaeon]
LNLLRLGRITTETELEAQAAKIGRAFSGEVLGAPTAFTFMISAVDYAVGPSYEIVIVGDSTKPKTQTLLSAINDRFIPNKIILLIPTDETAERITRLAPFTTHYKATNALPTAYVCTNYMCQNPTTDVKTLRNLLGS